MNKKTCICVCAAALAAVLARPAGADVMTYKGVGLSAPVQIHAPGHPADGEIVYAGQYKVSYQGGDYAAWCVDIDQFSGTAQVTQEDYTALPNSSAVAYLFDTYSNSLTGSTDAAALGVSIWEALTEAEGGPFNIGSGSFYISGNSAVASRASSMLASIPAGFYVPQEQLVVLHSDTLQDMLIGLSVGGGNLPMPEPATIALLVVGAAMGLSRRGARRTAWDRE